jgi:hypothetical protein
MAPVCQLLLWFVCCMCTGLVTWLNQLSNTVIRCDTTQKVAMEWPPWSFGFMPLPFVALRSGASFVWSMHRVILETQWDVETIKLLNFFKGGPIEVGAISLDPLVSLNWSLYPPSRCNDSFWWCYVLWCFLCWIFLKFADWTFCFQHIQVLLSICQSFCLDKYGIGVLGYGTNDFENWDQPRLIYLPYHCQ